ncbi:MAG: LytTR family transcriptional regulator [Lachnospiraceae bacterium]|nr:LytTR family transcriptional regulator [Lachnospiraceae bacterium]
MKIDILKDQNEEKIYVEIHCKDVTDEVSRLERHLKRFNSFIPASDNGEIVNVDLNDILYIESVDKKTFIYTDNRVLLTEKRLYEFEETLDEKDFFRCSKSTIININKVNKLKPEITRNILATLSNGEVVVVSRRYAIELKKLLNL